MEHALETRDRKDTVTESEAAAWDRHCFELERFQVRIYAFLASLLMPAWAPFDYLLARSHIGYFWTIRVVDIFVGVAVLYALRKAQTLRQVRTLALLETAAIGISIAIMLPLLEEHYLPYVFGFSTVFWAVAVVYSIPLRWAAAICGAILGGAVIAQLAHPGTRTVADVVGASFFIATTVIITLVQVSIRRRLERQAFLSRHRLAEANQKVLESERLKDQFFANVSHELRTPLTLISGPAESLLARATSDDDRQELDLILRNSRILLKHVNDLLSLSQFDAGRVGAAYRAVNLAELLRITAANFDGLANQKHMRYRVETPSELSAEVDPDQIQRVVLNLLGNAFKFTPPGGDIVCTLAASDDHAVVLEVADSGPGIPAADREAVFERFKQVDGGVTRRHGGVGLGLAIAREVVSLHQGAISVEGASQGGARFRVELPRRAPRGTPVGATGHDWRPDELLVRDTVDELGEHATPAPVKNGAGRAPLVLVVEDNPDMNQFICRTLACRYRTESALDGASGLALARSLQPDLILSDLMMPELSGIELLEQLRSDAELESVPMILLTAKADDAACERLLSAGAQDYLRKPFHAEELLARVGNHIAIKRTRDLLRAELETQSHDIEVLARQLSAKSRDLQTALDYTRLAKVQAEEASQLKSSFLALVSHELRTPLAALELQLQLVIRKDLPAPERAILNRMAGRLSRLHELIESLLQYSQLQSGRLESHDEQIDLGALIRECLEEVRPQAEDKRISLMSAIPERLPSCVCDRTRLRLILLNLLGNAVKFTDIGSVSLRLVTRGEEIRISVSDTGPGIPVEQKQRIFEPFVQLEIMQHKHLPGIGLGLALVRELSAALGGRVEVESEVGRGSTFTVALPTAPGPARGERRNVLVRLQPPARA